jgi:mannose-6-phosphate isomerase-like protein (cupin superfamily)
MSSHTSDADDLVPREPEPPAPLLLTSGRTLGFFAHFIAFTFVCMIVLVAAGTFPALIVALSWGIGLTLHAFFALLVPVLRALESDHHLERQLLQQAERIRGTTPRLPPPVSEANPAARRSLAARSIAELDIASSVFDVHHDFTIAARARKPGRPERVDGMTVGVVEMDADTPHGTEMHPDGDELLYVLEGRISISGESDPERRLELGPGQGCIVPRGEWHTLRVLERTRFVHMTPGPHSESRAD